MFCLVLREMRGVARGVSLYAALAGTVVLLITLVLLATGSGSAAGLHLAQSLAMANCLGIYALGFSVFSSAIVRERESGTLMLLQASDVSDVGVVLGLFAGRMFYASHMLVVQIPVALMCLALGGTTGRALMDLYAMLALQLATVGALGLLVSAVAQNGGMALMLSFLVFPAFGWLLAATPWSLAERVEYYESSLRLPISWGVVAVGALVLTCCCYHLRVVFCWRARRRAPKPRERPLDAERAFAWRVRYASFGGEYYLPVVAVLSVLAGWGVASVVYDPAAGFFVACSTWLTVCLLRLERMIPDEMKGNHTDALLLLPHSGVRMFEWMYDAHLRETAQLGRGVLWLAAALVIAVVTFSQAILLVCTVVVFGILMVFAAPWVVAVSRYVKIGATFVVLGWVALMCWWGVAISGGWLLLLIPLIVVLVYAGRSWRSRAIPQAEADATAQLTAGNWRSLDPHARVHLELLAHGDGGRQAPISSGYAARHALRAGVSVVGEYTFAHGRKVEPGASLEAVVTFYQPGAMPCTLWEGRKVAVQECGQIVGYATILQVLNPTLLTPNPGRSGQPEALSGL